MDLSALLTGDGYTVEGYTIDTRLAAFVDNEGEPCERCQTVGNTVSHTVYGFDGNASLYVSLDTCTACVVSTIQTLDPTVGVTVEFGLFAVLVDVLSVDTMCGPDCTCLHPDAV